MTAYGGLRGQAVTMMQAVVEQRRAQPPVMLATGEVADVYLDVKGVLTDCRRMRMAANAMLEHVMRYRPTAVGGPTMGADVLSHGMVIMDTTLEWFSVRDRRKTDHGLGLWIEGKRLDGHDRVVLMDDVANSGKSLIEAYERISETGAQILAVCPFVDRSGVAELALRTADEVWQPLVYDPLMTHDDLGLAPLKG